MAEENQNSTVEGINVPRDLEGTPAPNPASPLTHASPVGAGPVVETSSLSPPTSPREQLDFEAHYSALFAKNQSANESLNQIFELSTKIKSSIDSLAESRRKQIELTEQKDKIEVLLKEFNRSAAWTLNRKVFDTLREEYSEGYELLLELASIDQEVKKKEELLALIQEKKEKDAEDDLLEEDSDSESDYDDDDEVEENTNVIFYYLTVLSSSMKKAAYQAVSDAISLGISTSTTSTKMYESITSTFDADAKKLTKELANSVLERLKKQLEVIPAQQEELIKPLSIKEDKKRSLLAESPEKLSQIAEKNSLRGSKEDLTPPVTTAELVIESKKLIQAQLNAGYQTAYKTIVKSPGEPIDGKALAFTLIQEMGGVTRDLRALKALKPQRDKLLEEKNNIERLINGLDQNTGNQLISSIAQQRLVELKKALDAIDKQVSPLFPKFRQQQNLFLNATEQELDELIEENKVDDFDIEKFPRFAERKPTNTLINSVVTHYSFLLNGAADKRDNEDELLDQLIEKIDAVDRSSSQLELIRTRLDPRTLNLSKLDNTLNFLQSNQILKTLIQNDIKQLNDNLDLNQAELQRQVTKIDIEDVTKDQLMTENTANFANLRKINKELKGCIHSYKQLKQNVIDLSTIEAGIAATDTYIKENTNWWVTLTDFLAQLCSLFKCFKTDAGKLIDEAKAIKIELEACNAQCEQLIVAGLTRLEQNDIINETDLLDSIKEKHGEIELDEEINTANFAQNKTKTLAKLGLFKEKTNKEDKEEPDDSLESDYGSGY